MMRAELIPARAGFTSLVQPIGGLSRNINFNNNFIFIFNFFLTICIARLNFNYYY